jgi:hypothetical protein
VAADCLDVDAHPLGASDLGKGIAQRQYLRIERPALERQFRRGQQMLVVGIDANANGLSELIGIANTMLPPEEQITGRAEDIYVLRATGASLLAASGANAILIREMVGDHQLETIRRHYFKSHLTHMQTAVNRMVIPAFVPS